MNTSPRVMRKRYRARYSDLSGRQLGLCLQALGVPINRFVRHTGFNRETVRRWLSDHDKFTLPLWIDMLLMGYGLSKELRELEGPAPLPLDEWGALPTEEEARELASYQVDDEG